MRTGTIVTFIALGLLGLGTAPLASAQEGLALAAGEWEFEIETTKPGEEKPTEHVLNSCLSGGPLTPNGLMPWAKAQGCEVEDVVIEGDEMKWELNCKSDVMRGHGKGLFRAEGEKADGRVKITMRVGGRRLPLVTRWKARRLGDCAPTPAVAATGATRAE